MKWLRRIGWWLSRRRHEAELAEEMAHHEELKRRELEGSGLDRSAAARAGRRAMGPTAMMREQSSEVWVAPWLDRLTQDVKFALRSARKNPAFSLGVIGITALGIGATTTIFSVVDGIMLRPLPYPNPDRLIYFDWGSHSPPRFRDWQRTIGSIEAWAAVWSSQEDLAGEGRPERLGLARISPDAFPVYGGRPVLGRLFDQTDYAGAGDVAVLSDGLWRRRFGADSAVLGRTIDLGGRRLVVVGVVQPGFQEAHDFARGRTDVWVPLVITPEFDNPNYSILMVVGRLRPGVTVAAAREELAALAPRLAAENKEVHGTGDDGTEPFSIPVVPLQRVVVGDYARALTILLAAVGLMLLIACANVTNLYLARSTDRLREMAVRAALGAGRGRLTRQLVTESVTLGVIAGGVGLGLAVLGVRVLSSLYPGDLPRAGEVVVDGRILLFALSVAALVGVVFGLVPAWALRERQAHAAIKAGGPVDGRRRARLRSGLVVVEMALALVLLVGSGVLFRSLLKVVQVDPGFDPAGLIVARLQLGDPFTPERRLAFASAVTDRLRAIPGVTAVTAGVPGPMVTTGQRRCCWGHSTVKTDDGREVKGRIVLHPTGPGYFSLLGARVKGAEFAAGEVSAAPHPAVVSAGLAEKLYPGQDPIGRRISVGNETFLIRGTVTGLHQWGLDQGEGSEIFLPYAAFGSKFDRLNLVIRASASPAALIPAIRRAIWDLEPTVPADEISPVADLIRTSLAGPRFYSGLMGAFASLALILAAAGIYASMLYSVRQRTRELGIRIALGAGREKIAGMVVGQAGRLAILGLGIGLLGAAGLTRTLGGLLFEVGPGDPVAFGAAALVLGATVLAAAYLPARRAGQADPLTVLRAE